MARCVLLFSFFHMVLTQDQRIKIRELSRKGYSQRLIARQLKISLDSVQRWADRPFPANVNGIKPGRGRKPAFTRSEASQVDSFLAKYRTKGIKKLQLLNNKRFHKYADVTTLREYSHRFGYKWKKPTKNPFLTDRHRRLRTIWSKAHKYKTDWSKWVFCDENTFDLNPQSSGQRVKDNEILILETVKHSEQVQC